jgi:CRP-like cAMP-binding protein
MVLLDELENVAFLQYFAPAYVKKIAALARAKEYQAEDLIFCEGDHTPYVFLVLEGEVGLEIRVPSCGTVEVHTVCPGELLGWSPLLSSHPMTATARASTRCRLATIDAAQILALAEHDPRFGMEIFRRLSAALAERLHATRLQIPESHRDKFRTLKEAAD